MREKKIQSLRTVDELMSDKAGHALLLLHDIGDGLNLSHWRQKGCVIG